MLYPFLEKKKLEEITLNCISFDIIREEKVLFDEKAYQLRLGMASVVTSWFGRLVTGMTAERKVDFFGEFQSLRCPITSIKSFQTSFRRKKLPIASARPAAHGGNNREGITMMKECCRSL